MLKFSSSSQGQLGSSSSPAFASSCFLVSSSSGSGPSSSMLGFSLSDRGPLGSSSPAFASSSSGASLQLPSESPAPFSWSSTPSYSATTCTANIFSFSSSPFESTYSTLEASAPSSLFGTCRLSESAAPIYSSSFGSTSPASAASFSSPLSGSTAPANLNLLGSAATPTLSGFYSCQTCPSGATTTTTATISSFSPSFTMRIPATSSVSETQPTAAPPSIGNDKIGSEDEQVSEIVEKVPIDQMAKIGEDQDEKQGTMVGGHDCANSSMDSTTSIIEVATILAKVHVATAEQMATEANRPSAKEVDDEPPENSSTESEVFDVDKIGLSASGSLSSHESSSCADFEDLALALQNSSPSQYAPIFNQILGRYGDISNGSKLKSMEAKVAFFQLLAKVVEWLSNHTVESLDSCELQRMQEWIDDAEAVGFKVKWLQQRFKNIVSVSRYQERLMQFNEIGEQISATKVALKEMELRQITLKEEVDTIKVELDGDNFDKSNLCEGLF